MSRKVFISYRRDNSKYQARQIFSALSRVLPDKHVFMDIDSIPPGHNFRDILKGWVGECDIMLALIGPGWSDVADPNTGRSRLDNPGDFVRIEIGAALGRKIPVVPILLDGAEMPPRKNLPRDLKELVDRQAEHVEFRTFDGDVERLIRRLDLHDEPAAAPTGNEPAPTAPAKSGEATPIRLPDPPAVAQPPTLPPAPTPAIHELSIEPDELAATSLPPSIAIVPASTPMPDAPPAAALQLENTATDIPIKQPASASSASVGPSENTAKPAMATAVAFAIAGYFVTFLTVAAANDLPPVGTGATLAMLAVVAAAALVVLRGRSVGGAEVALYWFGCLPLLALACVAGLGKDEAGFLGGFFVCSGAAFISAYQLRRWRRATHGRTEAAIYFVGCALPLATFLVSLLAASRMGGIGIAIEPEADGGLTAILLAEIVLIGGVMWRVRGKVRTDAGEMIMYWLGGTAWTLFFTLTITALLDRVATGGTGHGEMLVPALIISVTLCIAWALFLWRRHRRSAHAA